MPPFDDVGVPPTVTATYSLPPAEKIVGPAAIWRAGLERPEHLAGLEVERAQDAVAAAREAEPGRGRRHAAALGLGRLELPDALAGRDVDRADRAVVVPALSAAPKLPFWSPRKTSPSRNLPLLLRRRQLLPGSSTAAVSAAALNT